MKGCQFSHFLWWFWSCAHAESASQFRVSSTIKAIPFLTLCLLLSPSCRSAAPANLTAPGAPSLGFYRCWTGGFAHLPAGTLTIAADGRYESYRPGGGGRYTFSSATSAIDFQDGDYHYWEYRGIVQRIPQSADPLNRIVLMPLNATRTIGSERPGDYQYCYLDSAVSEGRNSDGSDSPH